MNFFLLVQDEMAYFVRDSKPLSVRMVKRVHSDDGLSVRISEQKTRYFVIRRGSPYGNA